MTDPRPVLELIFIGFGNVARRTVRLLDEIGSRLPFQTRTVAVVTARHGAAWSEAGFDPRTAVRDIEAGRLLGGWPSSLPVPARGGDSNAHVIVALAERHAAAAQQGRLVCVETTLLDIRSGQPATSHALAALGSQTHVITANKGPVAFAYDMLSGIARVSDRQFLFEGTVMDGVPIFNLLRETLPGVRVDRFRGVVNSTTNHVLTVMEKGGTFDEALSQMQAEGIAEADPMLDVDGWDAAVKTAALMNVLMGARITPHDVAREGIREVSADDIRRARHRGERLRLVASAERRAGSPAGRVQIERVAAIDPLGSVAGQQNALLLETDVLGEIGILQRSGGLAQTAYAIVSDLTTIAVRQRL